MAATQHLVLKSTFLHWLSPKITKQGNHLLMSYVPTFPNLENMNISIMSYLSHVELNIFQANLSSITGYQIIRLGNFVLISNSLFGPEHFHS